MEKIKKFLFKNTGIKQTLAKNTLWLFIGVFGTRILKLIIFVYAARKLGVASWGLFSYALALMGIFSIISDIGINSVLLREIAKNGEKESQNYISTSFILKIILSFISSLALIAIIPFLNNVSGIEKLIPITALMLFIDSMREFGFSINRAFEKVEVEAITNLIANSALVIIGFVLITHTPTAFSLATAYVAAGIIGVFLMYKNIHPHLKHTFSLFKKKLLWPIFREGWPIAVVAIFSSIIVNMDTVILGWFRNASDIGLYAAAQKPVQIIYIVPGLISTSLLPIFSRLSFVDKEKLKLVISRSITFATALVLPIAVGGMLLGGKIMILLFGTEYAGATMVFKIMLIAIIANAPGIIMSNAIFAEGKQKKIMHFIMIGAIVNVLLCLLLIPHFGIYGAAISTTVSQIVANSFIIISARKIPALRFELQIKKIAFASAVMAVIILLLTQYLPLIITIILSGGAYIGILFALKEQILMDVREMFRG